MFFFVWWEKANQCAENTKKSANAAKNKASEALDKACDAAHSSGGQAQQKKEEAVGLIQQVNSL